MSVARHHYHDANHVLSRMSVGTQHSLYHEGQLSTKQPWGQKGRSGGNGRMVGKTVKNARMTRPMEH